MMTAQPIDVESDPRVRHVQATLNGRSYHYLLAVPPDGSFRRTVILIHGWPDLGIGWRYQIPLFLENGYRVVCPDMMGYGQTEAPRVPPNPVSLYSLKTAADDIAELARQLGAPKIVLGGHDWGGEVVWRTALWYPELASHVFVVCTPYAPPKETFYSIDELVAGPLPQFAYQKQLASGKLEENLRTEEQLKQFLVAIYSGRNSEGEVGFDPCYGVLFDNLPRLVPWKLFDGKYVRQYAINGLHGTLNWYRTRKVNFEDELKLSKTTIDVPTLFIATKQDSVLPPAMSMGMEKYIPHLTRGEVDAGHWALWQKREEVNAHIQAWLKNAVQGTGDEGMVQSAL